jgi:hypothetical protein
MGFFALLNHAINFLAPAVWLALMMPLLSRVFMKKMPLGRTLQAQAAIHFAACAVTLLAGLVLFGRDGMMLTYLAMVVVSATSQWAMLERLN